MKRARYAAVVVTAVLAVTGCGTSAEDLPLPGTTVSGESFVLQAKFDDALNLATGAKVKVNGIDVGRVKQVTTRDYKALVELRVKEDANIRDGATARLRYITPLGELFVDIQSPKTGTVLGASDTLEPPQTSTAPTVEDALASASLLINGGGLEQLQTITEEAQAAVGGRAPVIKQLLQRTATFLTEANATTGNIDRALRSLADASVVLNQREDVINRAVREIAPAARVLRENTDEFVALLEALVKLGRKANGLVNATRADLLATIRELGPVLDSFYSLRNRFGPGLRNLGLAGDVLDELVLGDWVPLWLSTDLGTTLGTLPRQTTGRSASDDRGVQPTIPRLPRLPNLPNLPSLPGAPGGNLVSPLTGGLNNLGGGR